MVKLVLVGLIGMLSVGMGAVVPESEMQARPEAVVRTETSAEEQSGLQVALQTTAPARTSKEAPTEVFIEAPAEVPMETTEQVPAEAWTETSAEAPTEAPAEPQTEAPAEPQTEAPAEPSYGGYGYCVNHFDGNGDGYCDYCETVCGSAGWGGHHSGRHGHGGRHCR